MATTLTITLDEAYVLHRHHEAAEKAAAERRNYDGAKQHRQRADEIAGAYWPASDWERAWSAKATRHD